MTQWLHVDTAARRITFKVHVQPNASANAVAGLHGEALKIRVAAPAIDDRANRALIDFLRRLLGVSFAQIRLRHGAHGRRKTIEISDADAALAERLRHLIDPPASQDKR